MGIPLKIFYHCNNVTAVNFMSLIVQGIVVKMSDSDYLVLRLGMSTTTCILNELLTFYLQYF